MWAGPACRLCLGATRFAFRRKVLDRIDVSYWRCESCGGVQTDRPTWLDAAYAIPGVHVDVGIASRTVKNWLALTTLLDRIAFPREALAVDFGGATGLLARLMRDVGYRFTACDRYSDPFFVDYFSQAGITGLNPELVTAFEVFEHFPDPHEQIDEILASRPRLVVFSTWFCDGQPDDWIYYAPECGQHVFFYTQDGLRRFAESRGYDLQLSSFFYLLVRRDGLEAVTHAAIAGFLSDSEALVRGRVADIFDSVKFGNDYIQSDYLAADKLFRGKLEELDIAVAVAPPPESPKGPYVSGASLHSREDTPQSRTETLMSAERDADPKRNLEHDNAEIVALGVPLHETWDYSDPAEKLYQLGTFGIHPSDIGLIAQNRHERADRIARLIEIEPHDVVLDLGSGMGFMAERLAPRALWFHCADVSPTYMDDCRKRVAHISNVETHLVPYADLSALDGKGVSKAYSALLFIHFNFYDLTYYLREVNRILNMGGLFFFDFNDGDNFRYDNPLDSFNSHIDDYRKRWPEWLCGCMQMSSGATLRAILPQIGFEIAALYPSRSAFTEIVVRKIA